MSLKETLTSVGLAEKEARIYLATLALHEGTAAAIARRAKIKRPTAYLILGALAEQGLVAHVERRGVLHFRALNPHALVEAQRERTRELERVLPELLALAATADPRPQMSVYEGRHALRQMMEDTLSTKGEILYWADMTVITTLVFKDYWKTYVRKRMERRIRVRGIIAFDRIALDFKRRASDELREVYVVPKERFPFKNEINIYDDKLAIISHEDLLGVVIENKNIADGQRAIFNLAFEYAKLLEPQVLKRVPPR